MNKETYEALKRFVDYALPSEYEHWQDCGKPKSGLIYHDIHRLEKWIDEVAKDYEEKIDNEKCPTCNTDLCHITIGEEDVFGCPKCKKEVSRYLEDIKSKIVVLGKEDRNDLAEWLSSSAF